nr:glycosyltransferase [Thermoanaerobaculia bacterium]
AAFAQEQGLTRLRWLGYVPYPELPRLYGACDLFVHAAGEERWGVSVEEAMACGLPVVASSQVGAGYDLIRRGGNGWTYPHGDPAALGTALERALRLKRSAVAAVNRDLLERWDYSASWRGILRAAERLTSQRSPTRA